MSGHADEAVYSKNFFLLLFVTHLSLVCAEHDCILGIVGQPVSLPCFHTELPTYENFSVEWRKDEKVVLRSVWGEDGNVETCSVNHAAISTDAALTGDFSLKLPAVHPKEDRMQFSLSFISGENKSEDFCTVCLKIAGWFPTQDVAGKNE